MPQHYVGSRLVNGLCRLCNRPRDEHKPAPSPAALLSAPICPSGTGLSAPEPTPLKNDYPAIYDLLYSDLKERDIGGEKKYGTRLQPHNGRDALKDAFQEAIDLVVYLRQAIFERDGK